MEKNLLVLIVFDIKIHIISTGKMLLVCSTIIFFLNSDIKKQKFLTM